VSGQSGGSSTRFYNEQGGGSQWVLHGTYAAGARATMQVSNANGRAPADAVRFVRAP
jgi:hypothetical protein